MRLIQLSDPHLIASGTERVRGHSPLSNFKVALSKVPSYSPDLLLITGDICHNGSRKGYFHCNQALKEIPKSIELSVISGNHDHPEIMREVLDNRISIGPSEIIFEEARLITLSSHLPNSAKGLLGSSQLSWLKERVSDKLHEGKPLLIALHHQPIILYDNFWDSVGLVDSESFVEILETINELKAVLFGHLHQHWQGTLPNRKDVQLLASPSTLCSFPAIQQCPLDKHNRMGGRLIEIDKEGRLSQSLLRW